MTRQIERKKHSKRLLYILSPKIIEARPIKLRFTKSESSFADMKNRSSCLELKTSQLVSNLPGSGIK